MSFRCGSSCVVRPMLGRKVVEGKQRVAILGQVPDRLVVFEAPISIKLSRNCVCATWLPSSD